MTWYRIVNQQANLGLDLAGQSAQNCTVVHCWQMQGQRSQLWGFIPVGILEAVKR